MNAKRAVVLVLGLALAVPSGIAAQRPGGMGRGAGMGMGMGLCPPPAPGGSEAENQQGMRGPRNPVRCLLERDDLGLNDDQVGQLKKLADELDQKNAPLVQKLDAARPEPGQARGDREEMRKRMQEMAPIVKELRGNDQASVKAALQVLNDDQRSTLQAAMRRGPRPGGGGQAMRGRGGRGEQLMRRGAMMMRRGQQMMMRGAKMMRRGGPPPMPGGGGS